MSHEYCFTCHSRFLTRGPKLPLCSAVSVSQSSWAVGRHRRVADWILPSLRSRFQAQCRLVLTCFVFGVMALSASRSADAVEYHITDLGNRTPTGINGSGQVVGFGDVSFEWEGLQYVTDHAFFYDGTTIHDLTPVPGTPGYLGSRAQGISDNGTVTGSADAYPVRYAFIYSGNTMHLLDHIPVEFPASGNMSGMAVNSAGKVVGYYEDRLTENSVTITGFYFDGTTAGRLPTLGGWGTTANGISEQGQMTGGADVSFPGSHHAYIYDGTTMQNLGTLAGGLYFSEGMAINELGQVTGWSYNLSFAKHAFFFDGNTMHDLGAMNATSSVGLDINDHGQIVGDLTDSGGYRHGFLYDPLLGMVKLDDLLDPSLGWIVSSGIGINNAGQILVQAYRPGEPWRALILTPVPEPSSVILGALGLAALGAWGRRGRRKTPRRGD